MLVDSGRCQCQSCALSRHVTLRTRPLPLPPCDPITVRQTMTRIRRAGPIGTCLYRTDPIHSVLVHSDTDPTRSDPMASVPDAGPALWLLAHQHCGTSIRSTYSMITDWQSVKSDGELYVLDARNSTISDVILEKFRVSLCREFTAS